MSKQKSAVTMANIAEPSRTVLFLEQVWPTKRLQTFGRTQIRLQPEGTRNLSSVVISGRDFDLRRWEFDSVDAKDLLTETGDFPFPPIGVVWCRSADENPNKQ